MRDDYNEISNDFKEYFVEINKKASLNFYKKEADVNILQFIADFLYDMRSYDKTIQIEHNAEVLRSTFHNGYCYYFAKLLKEAFNKGDICVTAPIGHVVWVYDGIPYDIEGVNSSECEVYIPEEFIGSLMNDFKHIPGTISTTTKEQIDDAINKYKSYLNINHKEPLVLYHD